MQRRASRGILVSVLSLLIGLGAACSDSAPAPVSIVGETPSSDPTVAPIGASTGIVFLGDSLTAGLGLLDEEAFPARIKGFFLEEGYNEVDIINAGVSGDTTAGGLRRIEPLLTQDARIVVVALGGNDALRGLSVAETKRNLDSIITLCLDRGVAVVLAGMEGPTNLGEDYRTSFRNAFSELAEQYRGRIRFVPFLLEGVGGIPSLNQNDGIHPNAEGAEKVAELLYPTVRDLVDEIPVGPVTW